jgi:hypothetical protein
LRSVGVERIQLTTTAVNDHYKQADDGTTDDDARVPAGSGQHEGNLDEIVGGVTASKHPPGFAAANALLPVSTHGDGARRLRRDGKQIASKD